MEDNPAKIIDGTESNEEFNFKCRYCQRNLSSRQNLKEHLYTHTGERPYKCDEPGCNQTFRQGSLLSIHKRIHSEIKSGINQEKTRRKCSFLKLTNYLKSEDNHFHIPMDKEHKELVSSSLGKDQLFFISKYL